MSKNWLDNNCQKWDQRLNVNVTALWYFPTFDKIGD